jgi:hypothetical protein
VDDMWASVRLTRLFVSYYNQARSRKRKSADDGKT